jgi:Methyltransferase domain
MPVENVARIGARRLPAPLYRLARHVRRQVRAKQAALRGHEFAAGFEDRQPPTPGENAPPNQLEAYFDAHRTGPGIWKWRHYFEIYDRHFQKFTGKKVDVVEIGVFSGGSFMMWRDYFGSQAQLHGVDIEPACRVYEGDGVRIFIGDQADPGVWREFLREVPAFDIVIDDGGHEASQQIETLEALLPHLRPGGVYLCEDSTGDDHAFHMYVAGLASQLHSVSSARPPMVYDTLPFQRSIDSIHLYPFVTVIEKRQTPLETLEAPKHGTEWQPFAHWLVDEHASLGGFR